MSTPPTKARPDASMDLLNNILRQPLDPDYTTANARSPRAKNRWAKAVVFLVAGALLSGGAAQTARSRPVAEAERTELISLIEQQNVAVDKDRQRVIDLEAQNRTLREQQLGNDSTAREISAEIEKLDVATGGRAVTGDGIVITLDDATDNAPSGIIMDLDIRQAANGLRVAGAEAIAINGHRLSVRTAIRGAGDAITVDYRSLTPPYRIEAIGDPSSLRTRFEQSAGGAWLSYLRDTQHITYDIASGKNLQLPADPGLGVTHATIAHK